MTDMFDFNNAGEQRSFDVMPSGTLVTLQMTIRPGGAGDHKWLKLAADGNSEGLDCEFTVVDGQYAKRKIWALFTLRGTTPGHAEAGEISRNTLRAILESARGIRPDDKSETAQLARKTSSWADFDQLRFMARLGVRPATAQHSARNVLLEIVTPERRAWKKPEQIDRGLFANSPAAAAPAATAPPANTIARPQWANPAQPAETR
jgi:hypothetical protein